MAKAAAAFEGASSCVKSDTWEARQKFQPIRRVQFFVKEKVGMSTSVVRGGPDEILSYVFGTDGLDVYAMVHGKIVNLSSTLSSAGIVRGCTVYIHRRLRGGSRENVPRSKGSEKGKGDGKFGPLGRKPYQLLRPSQPC